MNRIILLLLFTFVSMFSISIALSSCQNEETEEPDIVSNIAEEIQFNSNSDLKSLNFTTNKEWVVTIKYNQGDSWCTVYPMSGNAGNINIDISAIRNDGYENRSATLTIKTGNTIKTVAINQNQKNAILVSSGNLEINSTGGILDLEVSTNIDVRVLIPEEIEWIHYQPNGTRALTDKTLSLKIDENKAYYAREALIKISDIENEINETIAVTQNGSKSIIVENPGTLFSYFNSSQIQNVDSLIIEGTLNDEDFYFIKGMTNLKYIDISLISNQKLQSRLFEKNMHLEEVVLPNQLQTIPDGLFHLDTSITVESSKLKKCTIPSTVTNIGDNAFEHCIELTTITIPSNVTRIGTSAFSGTSISSIDIPASVTSIGPLAFYYCLKLEAFNVSSENDVFTDIDGVLTNKEKTILISYPNSKGAEYTVPGTITKIEVAAFAYCVELTAIYIPKSVKEIGELAFASCWNLSTMYISEGVSVIGDYAFTGSSITSIDIPNSVINIGNHAFEACSKLESITLSSNLMIINPNTFYFCLNLTSIIIPEGVTEIGYYAFANCFNLESITLPNSIKIINYEAFTGSTKIKEFHIKAMNPPIITGGIPFAMLYNLYIPKGVKQAYQNSVHWSGFRNYYEIY